MTKMSSKHQVTITLGRTGQVVTKGGKRSRGDRFGSNGDNFSFKRHQGDGIKWSPGVDGGVGPRYARNDLRLKLMRKRKSRQVQNVVAGRKDMDSRGQLMTAIHPPTSSYLGPHRSESSGTPFSSQIPNNEIVNSSRQGDYFGKFHSSETMRGPRARSPVRIIKRSIGLSPPRSFDGMQKVTWSRAGDVTRGPRFFSNEHLDNSTRTGCTPVTTSQANLVSRVAPTVGIMQKVPHMGEEPLTVASFLHSLGLGKYAIHFQAEEVDMSVLKQMRDNDFKEMGIPMGPRKKILLALIPPKRQTSAPQH